MNPLRLISTLFNSNSPTVNKLKISEIVEKHNCDIKFNDYSIFNYTDLGFDIDVNNVFHSIKWTDIERLQAYKTDLLTTDEICIYINFDNKTIIVTVETKGWYQFIGKLELALPLFKHNWEALVLETPFEYNLITIYERADRCNR